MVSFEFFKSTGGSIPITKPVNNNSTGFKSSVTDILYQYKDMLLNKRVPEVQLF